MGICCPVNTNKNNHIHEELELEINADLSILSWENLETLENKKSKNLIILKYQGEEYINFNTLQNLESYKDDYLLLYKFQQKSGSKKENIEKIVNQLKNNNFNNIYYIYWLNDKSSKNIEKIAQKLKNKNQDKIYFAILSNDLDEIKEVNKNLRNNGLKLLIVQSNLSLLRRNFIKIPEHYKINNSDVFIVSDIIMENDALSGKYDSNHLMPKNSEGAKLYNEKMEKIEQLNKVLKATAKDYNTNKISQIPIAWATSYGIKPIINGNQSDEKEIKDAIEALKIKLEERHIAGLERSVDNPIINLF